VCEKFFSQERENKEFVNGKKKNMKRWNVERSCGSLVAHAYVPLLLQQQQLLLLLLLLVLLILLFIGIKLDSGQNNNLSSNLSCK